MSRFAIALVAAAWLSACTERARCAADPTPPAGTSTIGLQECFTWAATYENHDCDWQVAVEGSGCCFELYDDAVLAGFSVAVGCTCPEEVGPQETCFDAMRAYTEQHAATY